MIYRAIESDFENRDRILKNHSDIKSLSKLIDHTLLKVDAKMYHGARDNCN